MDECFDYFELLDEKQIEAVVALRTGSILCGGVGSGKSRTALIFWLTKYRDLKAYIITTAHKRDTHDWEKEAHICEVKPDNYMVDSWNNIDKYLGVKNAFFIFDEQRVVGRGVWAKTFIKIAKRNSWILLSATPGDTWMDYWAVFVANGLYKNRTDFCRQHVIYSRVARFPKIEGYINEERLERYRKNILIDIPSEKKTRRHAKVLRCKYNETAYRQIARTRFDPKTQEPFADVSALCIALRKASHDDISRMELVTKIWRKHKRIIIFYNFNYELDVLRALKEFTNVAEWNGHKHEPVPTTKHFAYLVQYNAGAEAWECTTSDCMIFYSMNYSYKTMEQCCGRIDRRNNIYLDLYYYVLTTDSSIDRSILLALKEKRTFQESVFKRALSK